MGGNEFQWYTKRYWNPCNKWERAASRRPSDPKVNDWNYVGSCRL